MHETNKANRVELQCVPEAERREAQWRGDDGFEIGVGKFSDPFSCPAGRKTAVLQNDSCEIEGGAGGKTWWKWREPL